MANAKRRREKLLAALRAAGLTQEKLSRWRNLGNSVAGPIPDGHRARRYFITYAGLIAIAKEFGIEVPK